MGGCGTCGWLWHLWVVVALVDSCGHGGGHSLGLVEASMVVVALVVAVIGSDGCGSDGCGSHGCGSQWQ